MLESHIYEELSHNHQPYVLVFVVLALVKATRWATFIVVFISLSTEWATKREQKSHFLPLGSYCVESGCTVQL